MNLPFVHRNLKKHVSPNPFFQCNAMCLLKTKMVRTVHRNILYSVDLKICDSKRGFGMKSKNGRFQKWGLKSRKSRFWGSKWGLWGRFQRQKYFKIYPGLIPHHLGSIPIYKNSFLKKNQQKSSQIKKHR